MKSIIFLLFFIKGLHGLTGLEGKVVSFPTETATSYVELTPQHEEELEAFTICLRFNTSLTRSYSLFSFATSGSNNEILLWSYSQSSYSISIQDNEALFSIPNGWSTTGWPHFCVTWESDTGKAELWLNGKSLGTETLRRGSTVKSNPSIIIGQEHDSFGGSFDKSQSFVGNITDVHMWDYVISSCKIKSARYGGSYAKGNLIDWDTVTFHKSGNVIIEPKVEEDYY
ncbi:female protein-like [Latimeria chalumnae]|uniref:female protein-like n=1 Tax=Latimeria chalumnae TaxID=7897 RepID=UPI00313E8AA4